MHFDGLFCGVSVLWLARVQVDVKWYFVDGIACKLLEELLYTGEGRKRTLFEGSTVQL